MTNDNETVQASADVKADVEADVETADIEAADVEVTAPEEVSAPAAPSPDAARAMVPAKTRKPRRQRRSRKERAKRFFLWLLRLMIVLAALACCAGCAYTKLMNNDTFDVTFYTVADTGLENNLRIVQLSDLHQKEYGEANCDLIDKITALKPDIICVTGDMIIQYEANWDSFTSLCTHLAKIAPTYYCYGNHEVEEILKNHVDVKSMVEATGVTVLNNDSVTVTIQQDKLVIGGITQSRGGIAAYSNNAMGTFMGKEGYHILLTHYPENFDGYLEKTMNGLALAGHAHGGQIRLPILGALYAPDQGFLPKLTEGVNKIQQTTLIISRGLGDSDKFPRINNRPELVVVDLYNH